jgi:hypothetical protein
MQTHRVVIRPAQIHLRLKFTAAPIVVAVLTLLAPRATAQWVGCDAKWKSSEITAKWDINWSAPLGEGTKIQGIYTLGASHRTLNGKIQGNSIVGDWAEEDGRKGTFVFTELEAGRRLQVVFYYQGNRIEGSEWFCGPVPPKPEPPVETQVDTPAPTSSPSPRSSPTATPADFVDLGTSLRGRDSDGRDVDQFRTFDALPKPKQEKSLYKKGPRLPKQYNVNDLSIRIFVRGGWPVMLDYGLNSGAVAVLNISVEGVEPFSIKVEPAAREQIRFTLPDRFGSQRQVGKLHITASANIGEPANFQLYGIGVGGAGVQALRRTSRLGLDVQLASAGFSDQMHEHDQISLFGPRGVGLEPAAQITVDPTRINLRDKPRRVIAFSYKFRSAFGDGQWELWREVGPDALQVWHKGTGSISPNQTKSQKWNGKRSSPKGFSLGTHAIVLSAWHGKKGDGSSVIIRTAPNIVVE